MLAPDQVEELAQVIATIVKPLQADADLLRDDIALLRSALDEARGEIERIERGLEDSGFRVTWRRDQADEKTRAPLPDDRIELIEPRFLR